MSHTERDMATEDFAGGQEGSSPEQSQQELTFREQYRRIQAGQLSEDEYVRGQISREDELSRLAFFDALTGLPNYRHFTETWEREFRLAKRQSDQVTTLLGLDLDRFKKINDTLGHPAGDEFLQFLAKALSGLFRESDFLARMGGDEFNGILHVKDLRSAVLTVDRARIAIPGLADIEFGKKYPDFPWKDQTLSAGICIMAPTTDTSPEFFLRIVDQALYRAKGKEPMEPGESGRNRIVIAEYEAGGKNIQTKIVSTTYELGKPPQVKFS